MRPATGLLYWLLAWAVLGWLPILWQTLLATHEDALPNAISGWLIGGILLGVFAGLDAKWARPRLAARRIVQPIIAVGTWSPVHFELVNLSHRRLQLQVFDHFPGEVQSQGLPRPIEIQPGEEIRFTYRLRPAKRGQLEFQRLEVLVLSRWRLWQHALRLGEPQTIKVYPNFSTIVKFLHLAHDQNIAAMGIHLQRRRGEGQDFFQLREYRDSDTVRQIDWKATARHRKLIAKEYQEERDQRLIFLLDCGRRMRTMDDELSHFDHALNAMILLSFVALRQGDAVGWQTFAGIDRWQTARKGANALNAIIDALYEQQPTLNHADYWQAATQLVTRHRKRALIVVLTNLFEVESDELVAMTELLRKRHLVLLASLREAALDRWPENPVQRLDQAALYAAQCDFLAERDRINRELRASRCLVIDTSPNQLPIALVNQYLELKRSGQL